MYNDTSIVAVRKSAFSKNFRKPLYSSYSFANIPGTVEKILSGSTDLFSLPADVFGALKPNTKNVIALFVDAFGWSFFEKFKERFPLLRHAVESGCVSLLTSQFPSTTSAHVTTIGTGLPVSASGIFEWYYFEPAVDGVICPLMFSYAGDTGRETLKTAGYKLSSFFPTESFQERLAAKGIESSVFLSRNYADSSYSNAVFRGAEIHRYQNLASAFDKLTALLLSKKKQGYFYVYADAIDSKCHTFGPASPELDAAAQKVFETIEERLLKPLLNKDTGATLALFADHGQVGVSPDRVFYINREIPNFEKYLKRNKKGVPILFGGSSRDLFLYINPESEAEAMALLRQHLEGRAEVYSFEELVGAGIFQAAARTSPLQSRVGNVIILPYAGEQVSWFVQNKFECNFRGHHGGLTPDEMEIPLILISL